MRLDNDLLGRLSNDVRRHGWWLPWAALAAGLVVTVLLSLCAYLAYIDWPARPAPLPQKFVMEVDGKQGLVGTAFVYNSWGYDLQGVYTYQQYFWRVEVSPVLLSALVRSCGAKELGSAAEVPPAFWRLPPCWWRPNRNGAAKFFMTPDFDPANRCEDGCHYLLMYDEAEGVLYAWVKENF